MEKKLIKILTLAFAFMLVGCSNDPRSAFIPFSAIGQTFSPKPMYMRGLPEGDDSYSVGFRDGCDTYLGIQGVGLMQFKTFKQDTLRTINDQYYAQGYEDGRNHCTYIMHPAVN